MRFPRSNHLTPVATVPLVVDGIENGTCDAITFSSMSLPNLLENYPDLMKVELEEGEGFSDPSNPDNAAIAKGQDEMLDRPERDHRRHLRGGAPRDVGRIAWTASLRKR